MRALLCAIFITVASTSSTSVRAEAPPAQMPIFARTGFTAPVVIYGADGRAVSFPARPMQTPFAEIGRAYALPVSTIPQTYAIEPPEGVETYRSINRCPADVVIAMVTVSLPVTSEAVALDGKPIRNVRLVTSASEVVNEFEGTLFLARAGRTLTIPDNPMPGQTRYVSVQALSEPATPCDLRLHFGIGN